MESTKVRAFVIGPIGDRDADHGSEARASYESAIEIFEYVISPACLAVDIDAFRADHISKTGEINEQIFRLLRDSHVVIADLTDANPNVMYELGLRHTTGKLTFQIGEKGRLPFDISTIRTILFKRTEAGLVSAKRSLIASLAEGLEHGSDPVAATRIWFETPNSEDEHLVPDPDIPEEIEDLGFLEQLADMEAGFSEFTQTAVRGSSIIEEISEIMSSGTRRVQAITAAGNYSSQKLTVANQVAQELQDPATRLNIMSQDLRNHVDRIIPGIQYLLGAAAKDPSQLAEAPDFLSSLYRLIDASEQSADHSEAFADTVQETGNATRLLRRVCQSIRNSSIQIAKSSRRIASVRNIADKVGV